MKVIGVTGTIGSGKSTVCGILAALGCPVIDADREAHRSYRRGTHAYNDIVAAFGTSVLDADRRIDRKALGASVFADPEALGRLNRIVHPAARRRVQRTLHKLGALGHEFAVIEATLLIEAGWRDMVDLLWVVAAPEDDVIARLHRDRGQDAQQVRQRLQTQMPARQMMEYADEVIINDGDVDALRLRVESLYRGLSATPNHTC
ncbi:MAG: dephospho-CoA kinase [Dehalococcoidia bacterium]|nr:dephospho-CoA kinase [Dehalococcoidia bacterium]